ncbi:MAG TPA: hypothetical protein PL182_03360 [Pseudobdellovibrionaceae bacterium]|nr:hypothetical protein [Pseudobdellovibrionaceae bacterium]
MKIKFTLLMIAAGVLSACAGGKTPHESQNLASLEVPDDTVIEGKVFSYCNHTTSKSSTFKLALHSYVESGKVRNDLMYGMLTQLPDDLKTAGRVLRFFRWKVGADGNAEVDPSPIAFRLINANNGTDILSSRTILQWSDVAEAAASMHATEPKDFFRRAFLILNLADSLAQYQGLLAVSYKDGAETDRTTSLLPLFNIDPNGYANPSKDVTRPAVLQNYHPYKSDLGQNLSLATNQARLQTLCSPWSEGL